MKEKLRRSGAKIMASLIVLLGSLSYIMILAVLNGSVGFIAAMGVTVAGATGVAKALGVLGLCAEIPLAWGWIIGIAVGCGVVRGGLRYLEQYSNHYIAFKLLAVLRDKIFGALRVLCPAKLESKQKGSIIAMITSDIETLEVFYAHTISPICIAVLVSLAVFLFVGFVANWYLALVALAGFIVIGIVVPLISSKALKESGVNYRREFAGFIVGILLVHFELLDLGAMLIGVVTIFGSFGPVLAVSALPGNLTQTFASGDRVLNLLSETPAVTPVENGKTFDYENLSVKDLSFAYESNTPVLKDVCMHAQKGEIIGIVGESGCGKSTFLKLLLRFWEKDRGEINYNGIDVDTIDSDNLLDNVTMVSQTTYLFDESIEENLRIAKPDATQEEIERACKMASVHDFIMTLPEGYKTQVGAMGDNLSAGEKQRIGLARAFLKGSELILLDEPTSNVDSINEGMILKSLAEQKSKKSIILVSHRESTMAIADRIYKVENGVMTEGR